MNAGSRSSVASARVSPYRCSVVAMVAVLAPAVEEVRVYRHAPTFSVVRRREGPRSTAPLDRALPDLSSNRQRRRRSLGDGRAGCGQCARGSRPRLSRALRAPSIDRKQAPSERTRSRRRSCSRPARSSVAAASSALRIERATCSAIRTGTAFPIWRIISLHGPLKQYSSGNVCSRAASLGVKYLTDPSARRSMFSPPGTPCTPAFRVLAGSSIGDPVWPT